MQLTLTRTIRSPDGVFGVLRGPGFLFCTAEEEDLGNARSVSCIPAGTYPLRRTIYHKHGFPTFEVCNVPGRSRILIHPGNTEEDTQGCILLGLRPGRLRVLDENSGAYVQKRAVMSSKPAFDKFMFAMHGRDAAELTVAWAEGL